MATRSDSSERIIQTATLLFAEHGYNGVSARQLANAVGLNVATVHYHTGGKRELYLQVVRQLYDQELALVSAALGSQPIEVLTRPAELQAALGNLVDQLVAFLHAHPERAHLYMRRWLEGVDEISPVEAELSLALHRPLLDVLQQAQVAGSIRPDLEVSLFLRSFTWMLFSYFVTGPINWQTWHGDPHATESLRAFRVYLHEYVDHMLGFASNSSTDRRR